MIERVKAALVANLHEQGYTTAIDANGFCLIDTTVDMNLFVRAAIESIREPTEAMKCEPELGMFFGGLYVDDKYDEAALHVWHSMIDEALK